MDDYEFDWVSSFKPPCGIDPCLKLLNNTVVQDGTPEEEPAVVEKEPDVDWSRPGFTFQENYHPIFEKICDGLKSSTTILRFNCSFAGFTLEQTTRLMDAINCMKSLKYFTITDGEVIIPKDILQRIFNRLPKNLESVTVKLYSDPEFLVNLTESELYSSANIFELNISGFDPFMMEYQFFKQQIQLLQRSNINKLVWDEASLFGTTSQLDTRCWKEFCDYLSTNDKLIEWDSNAELNHEESAALANYVRHSKRLKTLKFYLTSDDSPTKNNILVDQHVQLCKAIAESPSITELYIAPHTQTKIMGQAISDIIRRSSTLQICTIVGSFVEEVTEALQHSESVRQCIVSADTQRDRELRDKYLQRNIKLQNSRVRDLLGIIYNIARNNTAPMNIPRDLWPIILSHVTIPGVSLDFGLITHSVFKDQAIRRVISRAASQL